jgi:HlyD family secretion protein
MRPLFRQKALEKLSSPDNIHELVEVTSSRSWLALLALGGLTIAFLGWLFLGELPRTVRGQGILIQSGGVAEVSLLATGIVQQILVKDGDDVKKNDTIALVAQPELQQQIQNALDKLHYLQEKRERFVKYSLADETQREPYLKKFELEETLETTRHLLKQTDEQIIAWEARNENKISLNSLRLTYGKHKREITLLEKEIQKMKIALSGQNTADSYELDAMESEINDLRRGIDELQVKYSLSAYVKSPYNGKIIELKARNRQVIEAGTPIVSIEVARAHAETVLEAVLYISPSEGKRIDEKMAVRIAPSTVRVEEYGYVEGIVEKVSEYPATKQGITRTLGNPDLAQNFTKDELPIAVVVKLLPAKTRSGFKWTSRKGPNSPIKAGTPCEGQIILDRQTPFKVFFPSLF